MKKISIFRNLAVNSAVLLCVVIFLASHVSAQDSVTKKQQKVITLKVNADKGGKTVTIDTSFTLDENFSEEILEKILKGNEEQLEEELEKMIRICHGPMVKRHADCCRGQMGCRRSGWYAECQEGPVKSMKLTCGETLSDVLGDIPMGAVKSYKIKETHEGKKITIEVSDDYPFYQGRDVFFFRAPHIEKEPEEKVESN